VGLAQLVRFLVVELNHPGSNPRFDMGVAFTANYSFSERRRPRRQRGAIGDRLRESQDQSQLSISEVLIGVGCACVCVFIGVSARTCMSNCICTVFLKKSTTVEAENTVLQGRFKVPIQQGQVHMNQLSTAEVQNMKYMSVPVAFAAGSAAAAAVEAAPAVAAKMSAASGKFPDRLNSRKQEPVYKLIN
jgi:hypothetical protein